MADLASYGNPDRDIEQALITLKKGTQLIKYSRAGKPKFCPFRISPDETTLIWYSRGQERKLKLSSVERIIPGQRTAVFKRYRRPDKEYLSFSLLYNNGERSLDLICKDKVEVDVWLAGLNALTSAGQTRARRSRSDFSDFGDAGSDLNQIANPFGAALDFTPNIYSGKPSIDLSYCENTLNSLRSDVGFEHANMQVRTSTGDGFRISVSSTPSCSSQLSGPDDIESLGDVYVWGEVWSEGVSSVGSGTAVPFKTDVLSPKPLESNVVLDVHQIAGGVRHVALVTRQGEVFTWGEESGGRLGHGIEKDYSRPQLVEFLAVTNIEFVACGEYHTSAISSSGDLYTWGDGTHNAGLLGHDSDVSHWIPKRVSGSLEGFRVMTVACGTWHSALTTSNGKLFTFGDGTFGALGHGDYESSPQPREVQSLSGLIAIKASCGVWHTAAIMEVITECPTSVPYRKLFTWGDGDKYRLGHGNKETCLVPTCITSLLEYSFNQLACGHDITVALTLSGHVFTMGSTSFGQLGNPHSDGKEPHLVEDKLVGEFVEEMACGTHHIAISTSRNEVYTWGRGANGRLGHGDMEDRNTPTLVEALRDRHVKNIACGSNYTAIICIHKWVSGADQSVCSGCRQAFGFTRKRHNCYNCGLVHCHACSSKKALKAALAPTPGKPHRVCDSCYAKLKKASEANNNPVYSKKMTALNISQRQMDVTARLDRGEGRTSRVLLSSTTEPGKYLKPKFSKHRTKFDCYSALQASQASSIQQLKDTAFPGSLSAVQNALKPVTIMAPQPQVTLSQQSQSAPNSKSSSPYARRRSAASSITPSFSRGVIESLKKTNVLLTQEVTKLQTQVKNLKQKSEIKDQKFKTMAEKATNIQTDKSSKCTHVAMEACNSIELKEVLDNLPHDISMSENVKSLQDQLESALNTNESAFENDSSMLQDVDNLQNLPDKASVDSESIKSQDNGMDTNANNTTRLSQNINGSTQHSCASVLDMSETVHQQNTERSSSLTKGSKTGGQTIVVEFDPGVYVTYIEFTNGAKIFKRVRFSKKLFAEQKAEEWWKQNKDKVLKKYNTSRTTNTSN